LGNNREINREFFAAAFEITGFCPKFENLAVKQGINREFCGYLRKPASIKHLLAFFQGCNKLSGN
jgi:hypothetical protein